MRGHASTIEARATRRPKHKQQKRCMSAALNPFSSLVKRSDSPQVANADMTLRQKGRVQCCVVRTA
jgi:hypothetical protein